MIEPFTTISALALFALVNPGLGVAVSLVNFAFGFAAWLDGWMAAAHHVQTAAPAAPLI